MGLKKAKTKTFDQTKVTLDAKPKVCPICNSDQIRTIIFIIPYESKEFIEMFESGEITIEQYAEEIRSSKPYWQCDICRGNFYGSEGAQDHFYRKVTDYSEGLYQTVFLKYSDYELCVDWCRVSVVHDFPMNKNSGH
jgi:hypothetical protein